MQDQLQTSAPFLWEQTPFNLGGKMAHKKKAHMKEKHHEHGKADEHKKMAMPGHKMAKHVYEGKKK